MEYASGQSEDDVESSDDDFLDALDDDTGAKAVVGLTFVTDPFSDHHETFIKKYHKKGIFILSFCFLRLNL